MAIVRKRVKKKQTERTHVLGLEITVDDTFGMEM